MSLVKMVKNTGRAVILYAALSGVEAIAEEMPVERPDSNPKPISATEEAERGNAIALSIVLAAGAVTAAYYYVTEGSYPTHNNY